MKASILLLILLLWGRLATVQSTYGNNPAAGHYQLVRGVKLYHETYRKGLPLHLIHSNGDIKTTAGNFHP